MDINILEQHAVSIFRVKVSGEILQIRQIARKVVIQIHGWGIEPSPGQQEIQEYKVGPYYEPE
jgi:hypothetical protein